jgi:hypothetical protein
MTQLEFKLGRRRYLPHQLKKHVQLLEREVMLLRIALNEERKTNADQRTFERRRGNQTSTDAR